MRHRDNSLTTKKYISDSLLFLLKSKSYADIQISEICEKAGVNRSTYYRNFTSKEAIVKHTYDSLFAEFIASDLSKNNSMERYLYNMFSYFYQYKQELLLLHKEALSYLFLDVLNTTFLEVLKDTSMHEVFKAYYHTGGIFNTYLLWFDQDMTLSAKQMTAYSLAVLPKDFEPFLSKKSQ